MSVIEHAKYYDSTMYNVSHAHTSCEIMYLISGSMKIEAGAETNLLMGGDCVLIKSRQHHNVTIDKTLPYRRFIGFINPWELKGLLVRPELFSMLTDISKSGIIAIKDRPDLYAVFERMSDIFANGGNIYSELGTALEIISEFYDVIKPQSPKASKRSGKILAEKVISYIEQNYAEDIKISDIAADNFISVGYLSHTFKSEIGMSPREYLTHIRCTHARELILHTGMKFSDIASVTGFCCANDMSRKIREYYGLSPTGIRFQK